jgi:hypothetical protein
MAQRNSDRDRMPRDTYVTPRWVYEALYTVEPWAREAWDCAPVNANFNFLDVEWAHDSVCTNPPYNLAVEFCRHALKIAPKVAFLLSLQFDSARTRRDLFADCPTFKAKYPLIRRIRWDNLVQSKAGPSENHAWYVWDAEHRGPPILGWLDKPDLLELDRHF